MSSQATIERRKRKSKSKTLKNTNAIKKKRGLRRTVKKLKRKQTRKMKGGALPESGRYFQSNPPSFLHKANAVWGGENAVFAPYSGDPVLAFSNQI